MTQRLGVLLNLPSIGVIGNSKASAVIQHPMEFVAYGVYSA
ncbi:hypothetical protein [Methylicorpusculum oleiharenae]|nr:hypothetical protein [Methylicorpusculum oleiharenae]